jgi:hypothetical protein
MIIIYKILNIFNPIKIETAIAITIVIKQILKDLFNKN